MVDVGRALRSAVETGKVRFGLREVRRAIAKGEAKLVILATDCPDGELNAGGKIKVYHFGGNNVELGAACGKPFSISALAVVDPGKSNVLSLQ